MVVAVCCAAVLTPVSVSAAGTLMTIVDPASNKGASVVARNDPGGYLKVTDMAGTQITPVDFNKGVNPMKTGVIASWGSPQDLYVTGLTVSSFGNAKVTLVRLVRQSGTLSCPVQYTNTTLPTG